MFGAMTTGTYEAVEQVIKEALRPKLKRKRRGIRIPAGDRSSGDSEDSRDRPSGDPGHRPSGSQSASSDCPSGDQGRRPSSDRDRDQGRSPSNDRDRDQGCSPSNDRDLPSGNEGGGRGAAAASSAAAFLDDPRLSERGW